MLMPTTSDRPEELSRRRARPGAIALLIAALALLASACGIQENAAPGRVPTPRSEKGIWLSQAEIRALPTSGPAWADVVEAASGSLGTPNIADQDSDHDVRTLAAALVAARTGDRAAKDKAVAGLSGAMGTERGARTLAVGRNLQSYVIAADVLGLQAANPGVGNRFRTWLQSVRTATFDGNTLVETSSKRPNNWGTHATASLTAVAAYLNDRAELDRLSKVFRGWTGDRQAYAGFKFGDLAWQANRSAPVGINPGKVDVAGHALGGALPEEMRRGGGLQWPPSGTGYPWGALNGAVVTAELLSRQGYDAWGWSDQAIARAVRFLDGLGWGPGNDDEWVLPLVNANYGRVATKFPAPASVGLGKNLGFTNWTHGASSPG
jgi:Alginate lyase